MCVMVYGLFCLRVVCELSKGVLRVSMCVFVIFCVLVYGVCIVWLFVSVRVFKCVCACV